VQRDTTAACWNTGRTDAGRITRQTPLRPSLVHYGNFFGKTAGIVPALQAEFLQFGDAVTLAFVYGSIAREEEQAHSDVDLMLIGSLSTADLVPMLKRLEESFQREINVTRYSEKEFRQKIRNKDHFILSVLKEKVLMIKGTQDELESAARAT
jgi:uncharacterized protein